MDASNDSLLHRLVDAPIGGNNARSDFRAALQRMGLASVFDVMRMGKAQFVLELGEHIDIDAEQIYDNAASYARQIGRLYQEHRIAPGDTRQRTRRSLGSDSPSASISYQGLFNENWDQFCKEGDIAAIDSPVAYLRALYLFAGQLESASSSPRKIPLGQRRPDLRKLMIDRQSAFVARPMLDIVNETLRSNIETHLAKTGTPMHTVLSNEQYPFSLPYDLHHQQCVLGLGADKPALGELNYRVSLKLPFSAGASAYGAVSQSAVEAQKLLSGLSPAQQKLLLAPASSDLDLRALKKTYGTESVDRLHDLEFFKERTGLTTDQVEQLLAQGAYRARTSTNSPASSHDNYGAAYINGPGSTEALTILKSTKAFTHASRERFARLQRMIRLHRWTGIPVTELDTLIVSALRSEGNTALTLNTNTLRTLGVYRYLNRRRGIAPEEFASLLHDMPISACGQQLPLFDEVFNRTQLLELPSIPKLDTTDLKTFSYLSAGLGLRVTQDSLLLLARQTKQHLASLEHDLPTVSSLYRQARIARMFGLSPFECTELTRLLGGENFCKALVTGALRSGRSSPPDILDVLMALDWAVDWLRDDNLEVAQWCRLFNAAENSLPLDRNLEKSLAPLRADADPLDVPRLLEILLHKVADLSAEYVPCVLKMAGTTAMEVATDIKSAPGTVPQSLATLLRAAQACQASHLSSATLQQLQDNPTWLAADSGGTLAPQTLYLLERFSHCARHQGRSESELLHYLHVANQDNAPDDANRLLADLLAWNVEEVSCLTAQLQYKRATSMDAVDWVMRCQACCKHTGLSASLLLKAVALNSDSATADWKIVGEALIAACH